MSQFITLLAGGLSLGCIYALIALGFVVVFKATRVVNFTHGSLVLLGAYVVGRTHDQLGFVRAALLGVAVATAAGALVDVVLVRRVRHADVGTLAILTLGVDILLATDLTRRIGTGVLTLGDPWGAAVVRLGEVRLPEARIAAAVVALLLLGGFLAAFKLSDWGIAMRAAAEHAETASLMGIRLGWVTASAWALAGALAAAAGLFFTAFPSPGVNTSVGLPAPLADQLGRFNGTVDEVAVYDHPLGPAAVTEHHEARQAATLLNAVSLASGKTHAQVAYNGDGDRVSQLTDANGGTWQPGVPAVQGGEGAYRVRIVADDPDGYWQLSEPSGTVAASQAGGGNGTYSNAALGVEGIFADSDDTAVHFNGRTSHVRLPDATLQASTSLSVELWFKTTSGGVLVGYQANTIEDPAGPGMHVPVLYVGSDGKLRGQFWHGVAAAVTTAGTVTDGAWHHVALTGNVSTQSMYLDGALIGTLTGTIDHLNMPYTYVGAGWIAGSRPAQFADPFGHFEGEIDEVAVYDRPLPAATVAQHATGHLVPLSTDVTLRDPAARTAAESYDPVRGNRLTRRTDTTGGTRTFTYDTGGFLAEVRDENGHPLFLGHDARGNLVSRATCEQWTGNQQTSTCSTSYTSYYLNATDPADPRNDQPTASRDRRSSGPADTTYRTAYAYTAAGDLQSVTTPATPDFPSGRTTTYTYTDGTEAAVGGGTAPAGLLERVATPRGSATSFAYRANGDLAQVTDPVGLVTMLAYDGLGRLLTSTEVSDSFPAGLTTTYTYDDWSHVLSVTDPASTNAVTGTTHTRQARSTYDVDGNLATWVVADLTGGDPSQTMTYTYDAGNRLETATDPENGVTRYTAYDLFGNNTALTDPGGNQYAYEYTPRNQLAEVTLRGWTGHPSSPSPAQDLAVEAFAYDPAGRLATQWDAVGRETRRTEGSTTTRETRWTLDQRGLAIAMLDPRGNTTDFRYDPAGRLVEATLPQVAVETAGQAPVSARPVTQTGYDTFGAVTETRDANGQVSRSTYDKLGRLTRTNLPSYTPPGGTAINPQEAYGYDPLGRMTSVTDPLGRATGFAYNQLGFLATRTDPAVGSPPGAPGVWRYDPNLVGEVEAATGPTGARVGAVYDDLGRMTSSIERERYPTALAAPTTHDYDDAGNVTRTVLPGNRIVTAAYNKANEQVSVSDPYNNPTTTSYDLLGRVAEVRLPGGLTTATTCDAEGWPATVRDKDGAGATLRTWSYEHDKAGNLTRGTSPLGHQTTYAYDALGRLTEQVEPVGGGSDPDLVAAYAFNEGSGATTTADASGRGNTGTVTGASWATAGKDGGALSFDGVNDLVTIADAASLDLTTGMTLEAWVKPTTLSSWRTVALKEHQFGLAYSLYANGDTNRPDSHVRIGGTERGVEGTAQLPLATWTHLAATYDGATLRLFVNGTQVATQSVSGSIETSGNPLRIGGNLFWGEYFAGLIDNVRVYDRALSATEIQADRDTAVGSPAPATTITTSFGYDAAGNRTRFTDGRGNPTISTYNSLGLLESLVEPATAAHPATADRTTTIGYDANTQPVTVVQPGGVRRDRTFDQLGRLTAETGSGPGLANVTRTLGYDLAGRLTSVNAPGGTNTYTYNDRGLPLTAAGPSGAASFAYDPAGRLTSRTDAAGTASFAYNLDDQLATATDPATGATRSYTYNTIRQLTGITHGTGGATRTLGYDTLRRPASDTLKSPTGATLASITYGYNAQDRLTSKTTTGLADAAANTYTYDQASRYPTRYRIIG